MSSKAKRLRKRAEAGNRRFKLYTLYGSMIGSVIVTIGKLSGKKENELIDDFASFSKDEKLALCQNIKEVCDYIIKDYNMPEEFKKYIVLCYDENDRYTPVVTLVDDEGYVQPLCRDGAYTGVLAQDDFEMEYIYD